MHNNPAQEKAVDLLLAAGFVTDGHTPAQHVRIPTQRSPVFGGVGGEARTLGNRARFVKPGTNRRVTVGRITTCFYEVENGETRNMVNVRTKELDRIQLLAAQGSHEKTD